MKSRDAGTFPSVAHACASRLLAVAASCATTAPEPPA